ncbi:right-handed parallel beta-helix repeat-containing protein [Plebeiibacterium sediminum]|uniref:Right-handed parallel beta-helix repeat-containing protein n=1 Tax=Plebeiibacterium sediminum TaxID=2992112 RepID=A0AAE3SG60_9BACT|nr:right-handed parallel beta-helix repeat-containing protein [Plebeiobacterium sediminum]MCW3788143.1 right-handed parallel beta-helix repeat-containing protein [Plebeiobacterium sediminum]
MRKYKILIAIVFICISIKTYALEGYLHQAVWSGVVYITKDVTLAKDSTITITPGTVVTFSPDTKFTLHGKLLANGTAEMPIIFTSSSADPQPGDWDCIYQNALWGSGPESSFSNCIFQYGGGNRNIGEDAMLNFIQGARGTVSNCSFKHSASSGLEINGSEISVDHCSFIDNAFYGVFVSGGHPYITNNTFTDNTSHAVFMRTVHITSNFTGNTMTNNGTNGFVIRGNDCFSTNDPCSLYDNDGIPYVLEDNQVTYFPLNIYEGTILKFSTTESFGNIGYKAHLYTGAKGGGEYGSIITHGTKENPVIFTSIYDDTIGGDTNNDEDATEASRGDWGYISILNGHAEFNHTIIRYAGATYPALEFKNGASGWVKYSIITKSNNVGIASNSTIIISDSEISDNTKDGITVTSEACKATISDNIINDNGGNGISANYHSAPLIKNNTINNNAYSAIYANSTLIDKPWTNNTATGNYINAITINSISTRKASTFYNPLTLPYVIENSMVTYPLLTIKPGTVCKFYTTESYSNIGYRANIYTGNSGFEDRGIIAAGTINDPIIFTSINDDSYINDTREDGDDIVPVAGDWASISCSKDTAVFKNCVFAYGGYGSTGSMLDISNLYNADINSCSFDYSASSGAKIYRGMATILNSSFTNSSRGILLEGSNNDSITRIKACDFYNNDIGCYTGNGAYITYSIFSNNNTGVKNYSKLLSLGQNETDSIGNNTFSNNNTYHVENRTNAKIKAIKNIWDSNVAAEIDAKIYDDNEYSSYGEVIFNPWITNTPTKVEASNNYGITVFPNPVIDIVHILTDQTILNISIYSTNGQFLKQVQSVDQINISELINGVYILRIQTSSKETIQKIIKTK